MNGIAELFKNGRVISATRSDEDFLHALECTAEIIFDLTPDLMNVSAQVKKCHEAGKKYFVHVDLAKGIGKDESGMRFLRRIGVDGILSTKLNMIKLAKDNGLFSVQRFFVVDSQSVHTTLESAKASKPDMIEIMPGTQCKVTERISKAIDIPINAGGLIESESEIRDVIKSGASAVSTGKRELWSIKI